jgi:hypothetical protein
VNHASVLGISVGLCVLALGPSADAYRETSHKESFTAWALDLVAEANKMADGEVLYDDEIWKDFRSPIIQGAFDEDFPLSESPRVLDQGFFWYGIRFNCRANNHYRHALSGIGLTDSPFIGLDDKDVDALSWAKMNPHFSRTEEFMGGAQWAYLTNELNPGHKSAVFTPPELDYGNMSWAKAIERFGYSERSKRLAYYTLGFVLHLLQDMGCPEHVHDDPHGGSGFSGYEMYVWENRDVLKTPVSALRPKRLKAIDVYFDRLAKLSYGLCRFYAGDDLNIDPKSDLARMFHLRPICRLDPRDYINELVGWTLENHDWGPNHPHIPRRVIAFGDGNVSPTLESDFTWDSEAYRRSPLWHKGHDQGEFWPTWREMEGVEGSPASDSKKGFFYVELSGDIFYNYSQRWERRHFYPKAFLPTPLPGFEKETKNWRIENLDKPIHMYHLIGKRIFPYIVQYSAGLIQHYAEIVNHPPFLESIIVSTFGEDKTPKYLPPGSSTPRYYASWSCESRILPGDQPLKYAKERKLNFVQGLAFTPCECSLWLEFSEPVQSVVANVGTNVVALRSDENAEVWRGFFEISPQGPSNERLNIKIQARDLNPHYANKGAELDSKPATIARRSSRNGYPWRGYQPGADRRHSIRVRRAGQEPINLNGEWCAQQADWYKVVISGSSDSLVYTGTDNRSYKHTGTLTLNPKLWERDSELSHSDLFYGGAMKDQPTTKMPANNTGNMWLCVRHGGEVEVKSEWFRPGETQAFVQSPWQALVRDVKK